jgi:Na+/proline symporter
MSPIIYISLVVLYVFVMLAVGYWCMQRTKNVGDFFLGGRTLGPWMSAFAYGTTYFSAVLFIGYAGRLGWGFGIQTMWIVIGNTFVGTFLAWYVLAGRTREMTARLNALTMPAFLRARYNSAPLQVISAVIVFVFLVPYSASVYMGLSYLFQRTLGLQYNEALVFLAALTGVYLVMGGYFAVAVSDFIRGIVEFFGVLTMVLLLVSMKGGLFASFTALQNPKYMPALHSPPPRAPVPTNLVSCWPGNGNANDIVGTNHGQLQGGINFARGEVGPAFNFNNTNADVFVPASASLDVGTGDGFTVEAWINSTNVAIRNPIFEWNPGNDASYEGVHFYIDPYTRSSFQPGTLYCNIIDTGGGVLPGHQLWSGEGVVQTNVSQPAASPDGKPISTMAIYYKGEEAGTGNLSRPLTRGVVLPGRQLQSSNGVVQPNVFQHVALTYDKTTGVATIYHNGAVVGSGNLGRFTPLTSYNLYLGRRPPTRGEAYTFAGRIDEPALYNRALSAAEIQAIYNAGSAGKWPPPPAGPAFPGWVTLLSLVLITSFGPWALPQMVQKFYSIRSKADVKRAMTIATVFALFMSFGAYYSGALTHLFFTDPKTDLLPIVDAATHKPNLDLLMPFFITSFVPQWLVLIILLMVFSASMSSLSSLVLVSSSAIAMDIYGAFGNRQKNDKRTMLLMRVLCAVFVILSLLIALSKVDVIVNLMVIAWGALAGAFLAPYVYGLFWRRTTKAGAYAGMISGVGTAVVLFFLWGKPLIPVAGAIAMFLPLLVVPIVSLLTQPPKPEIIATAFGDQPSAK